MVLEALAAISLAGNIVQFVTFTCQLFSTAASIHHADAGSTQTFQDVEYVTHELQRCSDKLASICTPQNQQAALQQHHSMLELGQKCNRAAGELLSAINKVKAKKPNSKWSSFRSAIATTWGEARIHDMAKTLDAYRHQLILELALLQRYLSNRIVSYKLTWSTAARIAYVLSICLNSLMGETVKE
jgi:hypothetical protein